MSWAFDLMRTVFDLDRRQWALVWVLVIVAHVWVDTLANNGQAEAEGIIRIAILHPPAIELIEDRFQVNVQFDRAIAGCAGGVLVTHSFADTQGGVVWAITRHSGTLADGDDMWVSKWLPIPFERDPRQSYSYAIEGNCLSANGETISDFSARTPHVIPRQMSGPLRDEKLQSERPEGRVSEPALVDIEPKRGRSPP